MPFFRFEHPDAKTNAAWSERFYEEMFAGGFLLHPRHMWFLSYAHSTEDVDRTVEAAREALKVVRARST